MMKINVEGLEKNVKPELANSVKYMKSAKSTISSMNVPTSFTYYSRLKSMPSSLLEIQERIEEMQKWVDEKIKLFTNAENNNISVLDSINDMIANSLSKIKGLSTESGSNKFGNGVGILETAGEKLQESDIEAIKNVGEILSDIANGIASGEIVLDMEEALKDANAAVGEGVQSILSGAWEGIKDIGSTILEGAKQVGATISNVVIGVIEGIGRLIEGIVDTFAIVGVTSLMGQAAQAVLPFALSGVKLYATLKFLGVDTTTLDKLIATGTENVANILKDVWGATMSFVAEDFVGSAHDMFYQTGIGQALDEYAIGPFKSDGIGYNITSGLGYVAGIVAITIATAGLGGIAVGGTTAATGAGTAAISATTAAISGFGNYTGEKWAEYRDASWEGIKRLYERGEITLEQYESFSFVRGLTEEGWADVVADYENGNIPPDQFELMKQIREMPEDWKSLQNSIKGIAYGAANGLWEGIQWYAGVKLGSFAIEGSKIASSAVRVGVDTAFNAADTPFRSLLESVSSNKSFEQAWLEQGGWESLLTNLGVGFIGSVGGEIFDNMDLSASKYVDYGNQGVRDLNAEYKLNVAINSMSEYFANHPRANISTERLIQAFNKVKVCSTDEEFIELVGKYGIAKNEAIHIRGIHITRPNIEIILLKPYSSAKVMMHEVNHDLGNVKGTYKKGIFFNSEGTSIRGINEAFTESIALKMAKIDGYGDSAYNVNVKHLNRITELLHSKGYTDIELGTYFSTDIDKKMNFAKTINKIVGNNNYYNELVKYMDIADGVGKIRDPKKVAEARVHLEGLVDLFERKISVWKR